MERECECELKLGLYKVNSSYHDTKCQYSKHGPNDNKIEIEGQGLSKHLEEQNKDSEIKRSYFDSKNIQSKCKCKLNLGVFKLSEIEGSYYDTKYIHDEYLVNEELKRKVDEIKIKSSQGIFHDKIIAFPNHIHLPDKVISLEGNKFQSYKDIYLQEYSKDVMHQSLINALRNLDHQAFVIKDFHTNYVLDMFKNSTSNLETLKRETQEESHSSLSSSQVDIFKLLSSTNIEELLSKV